MDLLEWVMHLECTIHLLAEALHLLEEALHLPEWALQDLEWLQALGVLHNSGDQCHHIMQRHLCGVRLLEKFLRRFTTSRILVFVIPKFIQIGGHHPWLHLGQLTCHRECLLLTGDHRWNAGYLVQDGGLLLLLVYLSGVHHKALLIGHTLLRKSMLVDSCLQTLMVMVTQNHLHRLLGSGPNGSSATVNGITHTMDVLHRQ